MGQDRLKYLLILSVQINTLTYRPLINSLLTGISGALKRLQQNCKTGLGCYKTSQKIQIWRIQN